MANIRNTKEWVDNVRQIEVGDRVIGGTDAPINICLSHLVGRTGYLKEKIDAVPSKTVAGLLKIDSATDSTDENTAASLKAVKIAYDKAEEAAWLALPSGAVLYFAGQTAPTGWLKANGAAVSRTTYAALFAAIGTTYGAGDGRSTFNLPDLRAEFLRGWDDGRGVDSGRTFGSQQGDAIRNITGTFNLLESRGLTATGAFKQKSAILVNTSFRSPGQGANFVVELDASGAVPTAAENRPRNIALLACIKI